MDTSEAGRQLIDGRFELVAPLGSGGMGTVWRARDIALHREVALKEVRPPDPATAAAQPGLADQMRERAVREARALARLAHPHVVTIHHIVEPAAGTDGHPWIVMEMVRGGSLHDRLESGPMPPAEVVRLGLDVLSALRAAHAEGILHRDVKPANVLLRPDGSAVLTDFGIAALHDSTGLTATGVLIGSPEYIAPERVRGEEGLAASDLWSLGMLLYVAAEGVHPLRRATSLATVVAVLDEPIPAPVRSGPLAPVLERLLVRDPAARPDGAQLEQLLRDASASLGSGHGPGAGPVAAAPAVSVPAAPATPGAPVVPGQYGPYGGPYGSPTPPPFGQGASPYAAPTTPVALASAPRRRPALIGAAITAVLAAAVIGIVQLMPDGNSGGDDTADSRATRPAVATPGGTPASTPGAKASTSKAGTARGSMLTPENVRIALDALKEKTGTTTFVDLKVYEGYVLAKIPTAPGADTVDAWQYRDGAAKRTGPDGTVKEGNPLIDMATVNWDALPSLFEQTKKEAGIEKPTMTYVVVEPWMMDQVPCMRPYLIDEYGRGGYALAGVDGKVKKVTKF
ncbi:serine/threonine-protein kinase [Streptomyces xanthophaeus]|uniref:serine/threonine-protein kinase n=1 Tax=Streptomyces xanthophaeus TaxID=67385 RepID=UPI0026476507|nr:serine/threonine-protein kinase [Streptomyces xanthophaeus]WKD30855.1 serine/threonine protein kinase [Streptomyces xanthophaeus]